MDRRLLIPFLLLLGLGGCEMLNLDNANARLEARREADGRAVGGACRHAGRALEDCYGQNPKTSKAAIYAGWRDMDAYMRENNISVVKPLGEEEVPPAAGKPPAEQKTPAGEAKPVSLTITPPVRKT